MNTYKRKITTIIEENLKKDIESISFSGGGFNVYYHFGIVDTLQQNDIEVKKAYGTSLGGLVAACLICKVKIAPIWEYHWKWRETHNTLTECSGHIKEHITNIFNIFFNKNDEIYKLANNRLFLNKTKLPFFTHTIISTYSSNQDLLDNIIQTQYIPYWTSNTFSHNMCIDGGIHNNSIGVNNTIFFNCINNRLFILFINIIKLLLLYVLHHKKTKFKYLYYIYIIITTLYQLKKMRITYRASETSLLTVFRPPNYNKAIQMSINGTYDCLKYLLN
jgi:hypothetical protein